MRAFAGSMSAFLRLDSEQAATTVSQDGIPPFRAGNDMVERQLIALAAILAGEAVAQEHVEPGEGGEAGRLDVALERHHRGQPHLEARAAHQRVILGDDVDPVEEDRLDRVLPTPNRQRIIAERTVVRIQNESRTIPRRDRPNMNRHARRSVLRRLPRPSPNPAALLLYSLRDALVKAPRSSAFPGFHARPGLAPGANRSAGLLLDRLHVGVRSP